MVECYDLDLIFMALSDSTRRSILEKVSKMEMTISEIAEDYKLTFANISKHIKVLEKANLVIKKRRGKEQVVSLSPETVKIAKEYMLKYEELWNMRFDKLDKLLKEGDL